MPDVDENRRTGVQPLLRAEQAVRESEARAAVRHEPVLGSLSWPLVRGFSNASRRRGNEAPTDTSTSHCSERPALSKVVREVGVSLEQICQRDWLRGPSDVRRMRDHHPSETLSVTGRSTANREFDSVVGHLDKEWINAP